ncbi:MAG TPA: hypothetical protein VML96_07385, partial [Egibacteraceae bacterium]|nr:hypothetical protein [Egibacteraceae bacterium]
MRERGTGRRTIFAVAVVVLGVVVVGAGVLLWSQDRTLETLRGQPFGDRNVAAAIDVLARSGVATYADSDDEQPLRPVAAPASPLALLRDQVRAMALEASAGGGIPGTELDALFEPDEELPPASYVVAGYVKEADTPGAELSRRLMGDQQLERASEVAYPQLVLVLFTADVIRERATPAGGTAAEHAGLTPAPGRGGRPMAMVAPVPPPPPPVADQVGSGPCSAVQNFIDTALRSVFDALRLGESGGVGGFFAAIWNFVVSALEVVVTRLIKTVTQKVVDMIARVAAVVGTVATVVSAIRPWTVKVAGEPFTREKGIVNVMPGQQGALVARVDLGGLDEWPAWAQDCATAAGQPLPNLRPEGAPVLWGDVIQNPPGLVTVNGAGSILDGQGSARLDFTTLIDD